MDAAPSCRYRYPEVKGTATIYIHIFSVLPKSIAAGLGQVIGKILRAIMRLKEFSFIAISLL
jgi:hypothetical protein